MLSAVFCPCLCSGNDTVLRRVLFEGGLGLGESYMDGHWDSDDVERLVYELLRIEDLTKVGLCLCWRFF